MAESARAGDLRDPDLSDRYTECLDRVRGAGVADCREDTYSSYGRCGECPYLGLCSVCPVSTVHIPGNQDPNRIADFPCAFSLTALGYRNRFLRSSA